MKETDYHIILMAIIAVTIVQCACAATNPEFVCYEDICNRGANDQFCDDHPKIRRCRDCEVECDKPKPAINCSRFCIDLLVNRTLEIRLKDEREKQCPPLEDVTNGRQNGSGSHDTGDVVGIRCYPEYVLAGIDTLECREFGQWSHKLPSCTRINVIDTVHWKALFFVMVILEVFTIIALFIVSMLLCKYRRKAKYKAVSQDNKNDNDSKANYDETKAKLISNETDECVPEIIEHRLVNGMQTSEKLNAEPLPPRPVAIDSVSEGLGESQSNSVDDITDQESSMEHDGSRKSSDVSFDMITNETDEKGGYISSDSGVNVLTGTGGLVLYAKNINITHTIGDNNTTNSNNGTIIQRKRNSITPHQPKSKISESDTDPHLPTQEYGETKTATQPEESSDDEKCMPAKNHQLADSSRHISNIHCNPDDTAGKAHVALGQTNIKLVDINGL